MKTLVMIVALLVVVLSAVVVTLRWRVVRREENERARRRDPRLLSPPPSPYTPSQGFRLVDGETPAPTPARPAPPRPRLDERDYVFGDVGGPLEEPLHAPRHDSHWALERMTRHRRRRWRSRQWMRLGVVVLVVVLAAGYALQRGHGAVPASSTTTWPARFVATAHGAHAASLTAPGSRYGVSVTASASTQVVIKGVADNYFHGPLSAGQSTTATVNERVAIFFDPAAASVALGGSSVTLPAGARAPYVLTITPTS
ncbi:MAG: hypothetical protein KGJ39_01425 [Acidobacteriota bacterium]|nr:hypothetical protein [Acidobacteriota bacterium]